MFLFEALGAERQKPRARPARKFCQEFYWKASPGGRSKIWASRKRGLNFSPIPSVAVAKWKGLTLPGDNLFSLRQTTSCFRPVPVRGFFRQVRQYPG